jgi:hypothetical protein
MASTYSTNLKIELIGTGEQSGTWGTTTNTNLGTLIEQAIAGYVTQAVTDGSATVLTIPNGTSSNGRNYVIELTGALTAARTVEVPAVDKPYIFFNNTTGGYSVTVKVSGQTGVTIANGKKAIVYTNSTDVIEVANAPVTEAGTQTLTNKTLTSPTINSATLSAPTVTGVATFAAGTVSAPAITTTGDTNTGIFFPAADTIAFAEGGAEALRINSDAQVVTAAGTVSLPAITTTGDLNTGIFFPAADTIAFAEGGVEALRINSDAQVVAAAGTVSLPVITTTGDLNTGIFFPAADTIAFAEGGAEVLRIDSAGNIGIGTSSPAASLSVLKQTTALSGTGNSYGLYMYPTSSGLTYIDSITGSTGNTSLGFRTYNNGTYNEIRIGSSGQLGIGGANYGTSGQVLTSGGASAAPSWATPTSTGVNVQQFDSSGTWTKPSLAAGSRVYIQAWGGGGSGARQSTAGACGGGGGGGYNERWLNLSQMGATETITIGAGGASRTGSNQAGDQGGNTTVGSLITAYGGAGSPVTTSGGGGGGQLSAGSGQAPGRPNIQTDESGGEYKQGGGSTGASALGKNDALFHGGGGGFATTAATGGSSSVWGGGGGGGGNATAAAGSSSFGGNGGAGGATGTAGTQPAGGGGGGTTTSGAGAAGRVIITVFPA